MADDCTRSNNSTGDAPIYIRCAVCESSLEPLDSSAGNGFYIVLGCPRHPACRVVIGQERIGGESAVALVNVEQLRNATGNRPAIPQDDGAVF